MKCFLQISIFIISLLGLGNVWFQLFGNGCAILLLLLQIFALVASYCFCFDENIINLSLTIDKLDSIYLRMTSDWNKIANGLLTKKEICDLWDSYKLQKDNINVDSYKFLEFLFIRKAFKDADGYLQKYFCGDSKNDNEY